MVKTGSKGNAQLDLWRMKTFCYYILVLVWIE